jgi:protein TonB
VPAAETQRISPASAVRATTTAAVLVTKVLPTYPEIARRANLTGKVDLEIEIDQEGKVVRATPVSGPPVFHAAAVAAVRQWRFQPATINGNRVPSQGKVSVVFNKQR